MKALTNNALKQIDNALWYTYGIKGDNYNDVYLQERGIISQYTGKVCSSGDHCNDEVVRTTMWKGLVALMYASDILYANGWLYNGTTYSKKITPQANGAISNLGLTSSATGIAGNYIFKQHASWPSVYLKSNIKLKGNGTSTSPFIIL